MAFCDVAAYRYAAGQAVNSRGEQGRAVLCVLPYRPAGSGLAACEPDIRNLRNEAGRAMAAYRFPILPLRK